VEIIGVIPAKAGIQYFKALLASAPVLDHDPGFAVVTV